MPADARTPTSAGASRVSRGRRAGLGLVAALALLLLAALVHSGERIWLRLSVERRPVRLEDLVSPRTRVDDHRMLINASSKFSRQWFASSVRRSESLVGWERVRRWGARERVSIELWDPVSGLRRTEVEWIEGELRFTSRDAQGRIRAQIRIDANTGQGEERTAPPWWWGDANDGTPSAPWISVGVPFEEWWESVRPR